MSDEDPYLKSVCLHQYLFGYELPDTILVLTESGHGFVLATRKKCDFLNKAVGKAPTGSKILSFSCFVKGKDESPSALTELYQSFFKAISDKDKAASNGKITMGVLDKEWEVNSEGKKGTTTVVQGWQQFLTSNPQVEKVDVSMAMGVVMAAKDQQEIDLLRKSSVLTNKLLKHGFIPRMEQIIEKEENLSHETLSNELEDMIDNPSKIKLNIPQEQVQSCYNPIIQSGGDYDLRASAQCNNKTLKYDIITVSFGSRYQFYCSNVARTFLVDPPKSVKETYDILIAVQDACIATMIPGNSLKAVYAAAVKKLEQEGRTDLVDKLPKTLGFSMGLDFREPAMLLTAKNSATFRSGMVFNLSLGFSDVVMAKSDIDSAHDKSAVRVFHFNQLFIAFPSDFFQYLMIVFNIHTMDKGKKAQDLCSFTGRYYLGN